MARRFIALTIAMTTSIVAAQPSDTDKAHALALFQQSDQQYKRGEFEQAASLLREAYALYPEPILLYNLARALEGSGDLAGAVEQYQRYLAAAPDIEDRGAIERRVATLQDQLAKREHAPPTPTVDVGHAAPVDSSPGGAQAGSRSAASATTVRSTRDSQRGPRSLPWVIAGAGVVALGTGGVFAYLSHARHGDAVDEPVQAEAVRLQDRAERDATFANVGFVGGGLLVAGGVAWGVLELRRHRHPAVLRGARLDVGPSWIGLAWELP